MPIGKRVYIASKFNRSEPQVQALRVQLEARGYDIVYDWTETPVPKPFSVYPQEAHMAAEEMAKAVMHCDIIIVLLAPDGLGMHIETGGALVAGIILQFIAGQKRKRILVVGEGNERSVFYFHKSVERVSDVESVLERLLPV